MARKRVFNVGDEVIIRSREYGIRERQNRRGVIDEIYEGKQKYRYQVRDDAGKYYELCQAEMLKIANAAGLTIMEDWS